MEDLIFVILGFIASLIDGCIGMAYGVFLTSSFTFLGYPLLIASSSVHLSEMFVAFFSAISHFKLGNMDMKIIKKILIPGVIGGIFGAYFLSNTNIKWLNTLVAIYLFFVGIYVLIKSFSNERKVSFRKLPLIGFIGGFVDAVGGGGWGPIVNGTLLAKGINPRKTIGSVNIVEFFVTFFQSMVFFYFVGFDIIKIVFFLSVGGALATPIAAFIVKKVNTKILMRLVAFVIISINIFNLYYCFIFNKSLN